MKQPKDCFVGAGYWLAWCETANRLYCWCWLLLLTNRMCFSDLNILSAVQQNTQNIKLLCAVICSWNYLENDKQLTCCSTLNTASTSPVIANNWRGTGCWCCVFCSRSGICVPWPWRVVHSCQQTKLRGISERAEKSWPSSWTLSECSHSCLISNSSQFFISWNLLLCSNIFKMH